MAHVYYLDKLTSQIKGYSQASKYETARDIDFKEKAKVIVPDRPTINDDDIIVIRNDTEMVFCGVCDEISTGKAPYTVTVRQMENIFDRSIYVGDESIISSTGIEDFIVSEINTNFVNSGDILYDKPYLTATASTHTRKSISVSSISDANNGIYNLKTFIGNALEKYGVMLHFTVTNGSILVNVSVDSANTLYLDTNFSDITNLNETYKINVLAKLCVKWGIPDNDTSYVDEETETLYVGNRLSETRYLTYYLQEDRTITTNASSSTRVDGSIKTIYIETESQDDMLEQVANEFSTNAYEHSITFDMSRDSQVYPKNDIYVGRSVQIRSKNTGLITSSIITKILESTDDVMRTVTIGKLPITLIEKIRRL